MSDTSTNPRATLHYVCDMLEQLKLVSGPHGGPFLAYLIEMARQEAAVELQRHGGRPVGGGERSPRQRNASV